MEILVTSKKGKVLEFLIQNPAKEIHLRGLARKIKISFPWVRKLVYTLVKEQLALKRREGGLVLVKANRDNETFRAIKRSYNLFSLYNVGLVSKLVDFYERPEAIVLFGSYSRGEDTEVSDIDIAIITKRGHIPDLSQFDKCLNRKIKLLVLEREKIEKDFLNTLANGIVLSGYLEVK